jgi:hypothetical protein
MKITNAIAALVECVKGCPGGVTRDALLANAHSNKTIDQALAAGLIRREIRDYAMPRNFKVEWFYIK